MDTKEDRYMPIEQRTLGRTALKVSLLGLGGGGNSRLGLSTGQSDDHAALVVRAALDMGVTLFDTARVYGTEPALGRALKGWRRDELVVSSKSPYLDEQGDLLSAQAFEENINASLRELGLDCIDIYFIHGLRLEFYSAARERFLPVLQRAHAAGKIRFLGLTEAFERDTRHEMLQRAVLDAGWDVFMVGYNLINPSARSRVLGQAHAKGIATLGMFAVRRALIDPGWLRKLLLRLEQSGDLPLGLSDQPDLLAALGLSGICETLSEAAYRFAAFAPGLDCVLSGTSSATHLRANLDAVALGPLPAAALQHLEDLFGRIDSVSGQVRE
jgi:L-galactose dehydrogenase